MQSAKPCKRVRDVAFEDLLGREQAYLDQELIKAKINGKVVMVTGAAGSIGSELCRQIAAFCPAALVAFDQAETPLFQLEREMNSRFPTLVFNSAIGNITRFNDVSRTIEQYQPSIVYHAAAYKHVPMLERHVFAAVEANIFGTWQVAQAASRHGVESFVLISTDKAVRPSSVMGVTKRVAELAIRALDKSSNTKFVAVRFGNVLGSSGSVVPIFKEQIAAGGPVTVTHPEMKRYFMTASEAGQLVLQASVLNAGGEVLVLDMGEPVMILDLARKMIMLSGLEPDTDIKIEFVGVRSGEKLFEDLRLQAECLAPTSHARVRSLVSSEGPDVRQFEACLGDLQASVNALDSWRVVLLLKELVPDYIPGSALCKNIMAVQRSCSAADGCAVIEAQTPEALLFNSAMQTDERVESVSVKV